MSQLYKMTGKKKPNQTNKNQLEFDLRARFTGIQKEKRQLNEDRKAGKVSEADYKEMMEDHEKAEMEIYDECNKHGIGVVGLLFN
jgi:hypothetical protein